MERRNLQVPKSHTGEAVTRILHDAMGVPHTFAKGLIDAGCVNLNGRPVKAHGQRCQAGDNVEVSYDPSRRYYPAAVPRDGKGFRIVHEDKEIVVANKEPGILSSPAPGDADESLAERIAESLKRRGIKRPQLFVVHRLDRHTSGLLAFAKSPHALESMTAQFESREAGRIYTALVEGRVEQDAGTIQSWLVEDPKTLSVRTTHLRGAGKRAITHFQVLERFAEATLVRVKLETGRKHQIRIHFAEIGHPVVGDRRYGTGSPLIDRVALHAETLSFRHPRTLETVSFDAPWPDDLTKLASKFRKNPIPRDESVAADQEVQPAFPPGQVSASDLSGSRPAGHGRSMDARGGTERGSEPSSGVRSAQGRRTGTRVAPFPAGLTITASTSRSDGPFAVAAAQMKSSARPGAAMQSTARVRPAMVSGLSRGSSSSDSRARRGSGAERSAGAFMSHSAGSLPSSDRGTAASLHTSARSPAGSLNTSGRSPAGSLPTSDRGRGISGATGSAAGMSPGTIEARRKVDHLLRQRAIGHKPAQTYVRTSPPPPPRSEWPSGEWKRKSSAGAGSVEPGAAAHSTVGSDAGSHSKPWQKRGEWKGKPGAGMRSAEIPGAVARSSRGADAGRDSKPWQKRGEWKAKPGAGMGSAEHPGAVARSSRGTDAGRDSKPWQKRGEWKGKPGAGAGSANHPGAAAHSARDAAAGSPSKPWQKRDDWKRKSGANVGFADRGDRTEPDANRPKHAIKTFRSSKPWKKRGAGSYKPESGAVNGERYVKARASDGSKPGRPAGGVHHKAGATGAHAKRKPWEFKQKGSTLRAARRRKIANARSKGKQR